MPLHAGHCWVHKWSFAYIHRPVSGGRIVLWKIYLHKQSPNLYAILGEDETEEEYLGDGDGPLAGTLVAFVCLLSTSSALAQLVPSFI